jgi:PadR family transcriptional regulator AphA
LTENVVLALLAEEPAHGFALARELSDATPLGEVWTVARPLVYRAIARLLDQGMVFEAGDEPGDPGPRRVIYGATDEGRAIAAGWRAEPVRHVREVRSTFLAKALLRRRAGEPLAPLVRQQRMIFEPLFSQLADRYRGGAGEGIITAWRFESTQAVARLLDRLEALDGEPGRAAGES